MPVSNPFIVDWSKPGAFGSEIRNSIQATTGNFNGSLTASASTNTFGANTNTFANLFINGAIGGNRNLSWQSAGSQRWNMFVNGSGGEAGGDGGSNLTLSYYTDAGLYKGDVFAARRSDGGFFVYTPVTFSGAFKHTGTTAGFFSATAITKPIVSGSKSSGAALTSLLAALVALGLITDSSTA